MGLSDGLSNPNKKDMVVADCTKLLDEQVASMGGLSGLALKAGYAAVKGIAPSYCTEAIERLLPQSFTALDPIWNEGVQTGDPVGHLVQNRSRTAEALLSVTDGRIEKSDNTTVRGVYSKLRNSAKKHVEEAVPGLAKVIDNYTKN
ncbi:hypothetical protein WA1_18095 [Scytonema hofmannii PCC 7110]|uniref:Uncharacterized protein n=1 Tax=Scytonema hofmannii PCC 7110 TaxID=128403 RepID=A0A139XB70_9CYAN|nr:hypothetical protein [Scytonema hofmannii]KYC41929.1 hypothetical protein WA1_18095 [Scytonema hofmannii PCC 7110]